MQKKLSEEYDKNGEGSFVVETAYPIPGIGRLCFDATRRYRDVGRYINHDPRLYNSKLSTPKLLQGKWRIALLAIKDIEVGEEVLYDYWERTQLWMRERTESGGREEREEAVGDEDGMGEGRFGGSGEWEKKIDGGVVGGSGDWEEKRDGGAVGGSGDWEEKRDGGAVGGSGDWKETAGGSGDWEGMGDDAVGGSGDWEGMGEGGISEGGSYIVVLSTHSCESSKHGVVAAKSEKLLPHKTHHNSFWCPVADCASGPVQKITQHLMKVHKMDHSRASKISAKKVRAPLEAMCLRLPNPATRSSQLLPLPLAVASTTAPSATSSSLSRTAHLPSQSASASTSHHATTPPHTVHTGGQFLNAFFTHLQTCQQPPKPVHCHPTGQGCGQIPDGPQPQRCRGAVFVGGEACRGLP